MSKEMNSFLKGLGFGVVAGAIAGVLLAPKSGKETREDIQKLATDLKGKAEDLYADAKKKLDKKVKAVKDLGKKIDEKKYTTLVNEIVDEYKSKDLLTSDSAKKLGSQLKREWTTVKKAFQS